MVFRLADRIILCPSRHAIEADGKQSRQIPFGDGQLEVWIQQTGEHHGRSPDVFVLKFPGAAGRAERSTDHPAACWTDLAAEQWTPNPPGYGGSTGRASLRQVDGMVQRIYTALADRADGRPIIVTGNSLGCVSALRLAAIRPVSGLILRNPPPLREVVMRRFGWKTIGIGAWFVARQIPASLCSIDNARQARIPALFIVSERDRIVPVPCQQRIIDAYAGDKRVMTLADADHASLMTAEQQAEYEQHLHWLRQQCGPGASY